MSTLLSASGPIRPPETRLLRVALVGSPRARAQLRAKVEGTVDVAGAFADLAAARASGLDVDAFLVSADVGSNTELADLIEPLTARETQVLELLAEGLSNKGIAARLGISDQTVKFHVASICGKLDAHTRTEAVRRAVRQGLIAL